MTTEAPGAPPLARCEGLVVGYGGRALLPPMDLEIRPGEFWVVVGRNGSGKTTWFKTLLGLIAPVSGRAELSTRGRRTRAAYVAQRADFDPIYPLPAHEVAAMGGLRGRRFLRRAAPDRLRSAIDAVGAGGFADRNFRDLSEGQKQRILLARVLVSEAELALLDEPTAAMDAVAEAEAMALMGELRDRFGLAVVVVSHHLRAAMRFADRVLFLDPDLDAALAGAPTSLLEAPLFRARYGDAIAEQLRG